MDTVTDPHSVAPAQQFKERELEDVQSWIAENRRTYAGKWVAFDSSGVLASGDRAEDVFGHPDVRRRFPPPFILKLQQFCGRIGE